MTKEKRPTIPLCIGLKPSRIIAVIVLVFLFHGISAQVSTTCVPSMVTGCSQNDYIDSFVLNGVATSGNAGCNNSTTSHTLFTAPVRTLVAGQTYTWAVTHNTTLAQKFAIWIDVNNDGAYNAAEMLVTTSVSAVSHTGTISIPLTAATGSNIAMRTRCKWGGTLWGTGNNEACAGYSWGETEDYKIVIVAGSTVTSNLSSSLVACYPFNGNAHEPLNFLSGTLSAVSPTVDRFNNTNSALAFGGTASSYIQLPNNPLLKPTNYISYAGWFKTNTIADHMLVFAFNGCGSYFEGYCLAFAQWGTSAMKALAVKSDGTCLGGGQALLFGTSTLSAQTWYHMGFTVGNDSIKVFVNGVQDGAMAINMAFTYTNTGVILGGSNVSFFNRPFNGSMDNGRFYNRKLTNQEFNLLYQNDPTCVEAMIPTSAGFSSPDTVCINQSVQPINASTGTVNTNYWSICNSTTAASPITSTINVSSSTGPVYMTVNKDGANYYAFVTGNISGGNLMRLYYGNSLSNTPTLTNLGGFSGSISQAEGIHIQQEGSNWYGVIVGSSSGYIAKVNFGGSLANTPTVTNLGNIGNLSYPHAIHVFKSGSNYYGLVLNQSAGWLTRLNFGNSIANTPTATALGMNTAVSSTVYNTPSQMQVISHNGNWHVFICNDGTSYSLTRLDFGNSLLNVPTATVLGNPGNMLNGPRGITLWPECGSIKGFIANRNTNQLLSVNIPGGPTGPVNLSSSGISASLNFPQTLFRVRVGDTSFVYAVNVTGNNLTLLKFPSCASMPSSTLQNPSSTTFTSAGTYTISLATNENQADGSVYCKQLTVIPNFAVNATVSPATACTGQSRTLTASGANSYTWYPGNLVGSAVTVTPPLGNMVYTVVGAIGSCTAQHTFTVSTLSGSSVSVNVNPPAVCQGNTATLTASGALTYSWQPGNSLGPLLIVTPFASTQYTLSGTNTSGCITSTVVTLTVTPYPSLGILPATTSVCSGSAALTMTATGAANYTWMPGGVFTNTFQVSPTSTTVYSLTGATNGCTSNTTLQVTVISSPTVTASVSSNTTCSGTSVILSASGATSYTWLPVNLPGGTITVSPLANTIYTVRGSNGACTASATVNVSVFPLPVLLPVSSSPSICLGQSAVLSASNAVTYTWQPGTILLQTHTVSPTSSTIYTVSGTSAAGCIGTATVMQVVSPVPTISISPALPTICAPGPLTLSATGATNYTWLPVNQNGSVITVTLNANTIFTVNGVVNGCPGTATRIVIVNPKPVVIASASSPSICFGNTVTLSATGAASFQWAPGGQTTQSITIQPGSSTNYTVTGTSTAGCTGTAVVGVTVAPSPTVNTFIGPSSTVCTGNTYSISANGANSYTWNNGVTNSSFTITPLTNTTTIYTVTGAIGACVATATRTVSAISTPTVFAIGSPTIVCAGGTVNLVAGGATNYVWYIPGAVSGSSISVTPTSSFVYTVTGNSGGCSRSTTVSIAVNPNPTLSINSSNNPACAGNTIQLSGAGATNYTWLPGGQNTQTISANPGVTTTFTLHGTNLFGCRGTSFYTQVISPLPAITISANTTTICAGHILVLQPGGGGPSAAYTLQPGGITTGNNFILTPLATTVYTVSGRIGSCVSSNTILITVAPAVTITASASQSVICRGQQVTLTATGANAYTWQPGPFFQSQIVVSPNIPTLYQVRGSNAAGCTASTAVVIIVQPLPTVNVVVLGVGSQSSICAGTTVTLAANGALSHTWEPGGFIGSFFVVSPTVTTTYTVRGGSNCVGERTVRVNVFPYPTLTISMTSDNVCAGGTVGLVAGGASNYTWLPGGSNAPNITAQPQVDATYTLIGSQGPGCTGVSSALIRVNQKPVVSATAPSVACLGSTQTVVLHGANGYLWNGIPLSNSVVVYAVQSANTSTIIGFDGNGCSDTITLAIPVMPTPTAGIIPSGTLLCAGESVTLEAAGSGQFSWLPDVVSGPTLVSEPLSTTTFTLLNSDGQCTGAAIITVSVIPCGKPLFGLTNAASTPLLYNNNYWLVNYSVTVVNQSPTELNRIELTNDLRSTFHEPITYTLHEVPRLISHQSAITMNSAFDGVNDKLLTVPASSSLMPMKVDTILITLLVNPHEFSGIVKNSVVGTALTPWNIMVSDSSNNGFGWDPDNDGDPTNNNVPTAIELISINLFIPDAFSPNGDGNYDVFVIKGLGDRDAVFTVFNRWGNEVYKVGGSRIEWDGYANKGVVAGTGKVPPGTYFYVLEFTGAEKGESLKGFVVVEY